MEQKEKTEAKMPPIAKEKKRRLTSYEWGELLGLLKLGNHTQLELAKMYGVTAAGIQYKRKALGGIDIGQDSMSKSSLDKVIKERKEDAIEQKKIVNELKQIRGFTPAEAADLITEAKKETFLRNEQIGKLATHLLANAHKDKDIGKIKDSVKVLLDMQTIFEKQLRLAGFCLGFKDDNFDSIEDLPSITITKMTSGDIKAAQRKMSDDSDGVEDGRYSEIDD